MQQEVFKTAYSYNRICLVPKKGILSSRAKADTTVTFGSRQFMLPVVPSNMKCSINGDLAHRLSYQGFFYIMHRFDDTVNFITQSINNQHFISISVGVKAEDRLLIKHIQKNNIDVEYITLDIAHGHCNESIAMTGFIKDTLPGIFLIAGNVATPEGAYDLVQAGADAIKVGIGQGSACTTKDKTGFTMPMFTCVRNIANANLKAPIIADGGIKCNGDIAKAIAAGADLVMCGSLFAECIDSPADIFEDEEGQPYKLYYGSASVHNKKDSRHIEGTIRKVPQNTMSYLEKMEEIRQDLSSSISYCGGTTLADLKGADFYVIG